MQKLGWSWWGCLPQSVLIDYGTASCYLSTIVILRRAFSRNVGAVLPQAQRMHYRAWQRHTANGKLWIYRKWPNKISMRSLFSYLLGGFFDHDSLSLDWCFKWDAESVGKSSRTGIPSSARLNAPWITPIRNCKKFIKKPPNSLARSKARRKIITMDK